MEAAAPMAPRANDPMTAPLHPIAAVRGPEWQRVAAGSYRHRTGEVWITRGPGGSWRVCYVSTGEPSAWCVTLDEAKARAAFLLGGKTHQPASATSKPSLEWVRGYQAAREQAARLAEKPVHDLTYGPCRGAYEETARGIRAMMPEDAPRDA